MALSYYMGNGCRSVLDVKFTSRLGCEWVSDYGNGQIARLVEDLINFRNVSWAIPY